jgi:hypothetical protein
VPQYFDAIFMTIGYESPCGRGREKGLQDENISPASRANIRIRTYSYPGVSILNG